MTQAPAAGRPDSTMDDTHVEALTAAYRHSRSALKSYLTRLVVRPEVAEELVQEAAARMLAPDTAPAPSIDARAWLFRVGTNLALDHLRRHSTWRENLLLEAREWALDDEEFVDQSKAMCGSPETASIAREHLAMCLSCNLRNLLPQWAAALLLVEVYGFSVDEAAGLLESTPAQAKNWIQSARARLRDRYAGTCALINKQGVCYQCSELAEFFNGQPADPLAGTAGDLDARLAVLREQPEVGPWHRLMMRLVDDVLGMPGARPRRGGRA